MSNVVFRDECPADAAAITEVTRAAFAAESRSSHTEELIIEALRRASALSVSLGGVAAKYLLSLPFGFFSANGEVTYHVAFGIEG